jgi:hypothetical protein
MAIWLQLFGDYGCDCDNDKKKDEDESREKRVRLPCPSSARGGSPSGLAQLHVPAVDRPPGGSYRMEKSVGKGNMRRRGHPSRNGKVPDSPGG